jgi:hypothetical protein
MKKFTILSLFLGIVLAFGGRNAWAGVPYGGPYNIPCIVQAEDFDEGGQGVGYSPASLESDITNEYRPEVVGLTIEDGDNDDGWHIAVAAGEWYQYTVTAAAAGTYDLVFHWAAGLNQGTQVQIFIGDTELPIQNAPLTGSTDTYKFFTIHNVAFAAGENVITVKPVNYGSFDKFEIVKYTGTAYTALEGDGEAPAIPGLVEAEYFDNGGYRTSFPGDGGSKNVIRKGESIPIVDADGITAIILGNGDYTYYTVPVAEEGKYYAWIEGYSTGDGRLSIIINEEEVGTNSIPAADDPTMQYLRTAPVAFPGGTVTYKLQYLGAGKLYLSNLYWEPMSLDYAGTPYNGPHIVPCVIEAEDFDNGGEGIAWHDDPGTPSNWDAYNDDYGRVYDELGNLIDVELEYSACINIAWTGTGEWINYSIEVPEGEDGLYDFLFTFGSDPERINNKLYVDGELVATFNTGVTGNCWIYTVTDESQVHNVPLTAGSHYVTLEWGSGGNINFDKFEIVKAGTAQFAYNGPHTVPCVVQAEDFDTGGLGVAYNDDEGMQNGQVNTYRDNPDVEIEDDGANDGYHIGWTSPGEWYEYTLTVSEEGNYDFIFTWADQNDGTPVSITVNDGEPIEATSINTGSFSVYGTFTIPNVPLPSGKPVVRVTLTHGNFDKFEVVHATAIKAVNSGKGSVYAAEGKLFVSGYSSDASVEVYSIVGQRVASVKSVADRAINLPSNGLYIVKVTDGSKTEGFKVLAK